MTRQRNDKHSTEFGLWLREQEEIDSSIGYVASNLDFIWSNYKTGDWILIEEKRYMAEMTYAQKKLFIILDKSIDNTQYKGFFVITFEKTSPVDGKVYISRLNGKKIEVSADRLVKFLKLEGKYKNKLD